MDAGHRWAGSRRGATARAPGEGSGTHARRRRHGEEDRERWREEEGKGQQRQLPLLCLSRWEATLTPMSRRHFFSHTRYGSARGVASDKFLSSRPRLVFDFLRCSFQACSVPLPLNNFILSEAHARWHPPPLSRSSSIPSRGTFALPDAKLPRPSLPLSQHRGNPPSNTHTRSSRRRNRRKAGIGPRLPATRA